MSLPSLVEELWQRYPNLHLFIIDDASTDGTWEWCRALEETDPRIVCVHRECKQGLGNANVVAMQHAIDRRYHFLVTMDADRSHAPSDVQTIVCRLDQHPEVSVVLGSRYIPGGRIVGWPWRRKWLSWLVNQYSRHVLGVPAMDCSSGFRGYRVADLQGLHWDQLAAMEYAFYEAILYQLTRMGRSMQEVPITFVERRLGRSKASLSTMFRSAVAMLRIRHSTPTSVSASVSSR